MSKYFGVFVPLTPPIVRILCSEPYLVKSKFQEITLTEGAAVLPTKEVPVYKNHINHHKNGEVLDDPKIGRRIWRIMFYFTKIQVKKLLARVAQALNILFFIRSVTFVT